jgi:hypothetical protein
MIWLFKVNEVFWNNNKQKNEVEFLKRVEKANTEFPIVFGQDDLGGYALLDGSHRLYKLYQQGETNVSVKILSVDDSIRLKNIVKSTVNFDFLNSNVNLAFKNLVENIGAQAIHDNKFNHFDIYYRVDDNTIEEYKFSIAVDSATDAIYTVDKNFQISGKTIIDKNEDFLDSLGIKLLFDSSDLRDINKYLLSIKLG